MQHVFQSIYNQLQCSCRSSCKIMNDPLNSCRIQCYRASVPRKQWVKVPRIGQPPATRVVPAYHFFQVANTGFLACMCQLDTGTAPLFMNKGGDLLQLFNMLIFQIPASAAEMRPSGDRSGFRNTQPGTTYSTTAKMHQVPVVHKPAFS